MEIHTTQVSVTHLVSIGVTALLDGFVEQKTDNIINMRVEGYFCTSYNYVLLLVPNLIKSQTQMRRYVYINMVLTST